MKKSLHITLALLFFYLGQLYAQGDNKPLCITDLKQVSDQTFALISREESSIRMYDNTFKKPLSIIKLPASPTGLTIKDGLCYVTTFDNSKGELHVVDLQSKQIKATINTGSGARAPLFSADHKKLYTLNQFDNTISEIDVASLSCQRTFQVLREPKAAVIGKEGRYMYVNNFLPA